jgi:5-(carboxyamino)imidazole ribonucleotide mutase
MIEAKFKKVVQANTGCAVVMAGSDSDVVHVQKIVTSLRKYKIPYQVRICSAHKQPIELLHIIEKYNALGGSIAYVAVAGGTDALSGTLSYHALGPVISCPPDAPNESCLTNPSGSSNAYIERPENVGRFIAQIFSGVHPKFREQLQREKARKMAGLRRADALAKNKEKEL